MINDEKITHSSDKSESEGIASLAKPINSMPIIKEQEAREFIYEFNENKVTEEFLDSCKKAGRLFGRRN